MHTLQYNFLRYKIYFCTVNIIMDVILIQVIDKSYLFGFAHFLLPLFVFRQCFDTCITMAVKLKEHKLMISWKMPFLINGRTDRGCTIKWFWQQLFHNSSRNYVVYGLLPPNFLMTYSNFKPIRLNTRYVMRQGLVGRTKTKVPVTKFSSLRLIKKL